MISSAEIDALVARLNGYNPPDRTVPEQRQMAQDIADAAAALTALKKQTDEQTFVMSLASEHRDELEQQIAALKGDAVPREPTDAMLEAGIGPFLAAHDPMFSANEPCGPIWKCMWDAARAEKL